MLPRHESGVDEQGFLLVARSSRVVLVAEWAPYLVAYAFHFRAGFGSVEPHAYLLMPVSFKYENEYRYIWLNCFSPSAYPFAEPLNILSPRSV